MITGSVKLRASFSPVAKDIHSKKIQQYKRYVQFCCFTALVRDKLLIEKHIAIKSGKQDEDTKDGIFCKISNNVYEIHEQRSEAKGETKSWQMECYSFAAA